MMTFSLYIEIQWLSPSPLIKKKRTKNKEIKFGIKFALLTTKGNDHLLIEK